MPAIVNIPRTGTPTHYDTLKTVLQNDYLEALQEPSLIRERQIESYLVIFYVESYLVIFYVRLTLLYSKSLKIETSSVSVRVPAGNRWCTCISIISGKFTKRTIHKSVSRV